MPTIKVITSRRDLDELEPEWERLVAEDCADITGLDASATFAWSTTLIDTKLHDDDWRVLVARADGRVTGILPLFCPGGTSAAARTDWRLLHDVYGGRGGFLVAAEKPETAHHLLSAAIREIDSIGSLSLTLCEGSRSHAILQGACSGGSFLHVRPTASFVSPYIHFSGEVSDYLAQLDKEFRDVLRRRTKRLHGMGSVTCRTFRDPASVDELLAVVRIVEDASWKNEAGTAITSNEDQSRLYDVLVPRLANAGLLESMAIFLDDRPIAYQLGARTGDTVLGIKTSFDNALRSVAPGTIMTQLYLDHLRAIGCPNFDLMGDTEPYKLKWTGRTYRRTTYRCYARNFNGVLAFAQSGARYMASKFIRRLGTKSRFVSPADKLES